MELLAALLAMCITVMLIPPLSKMAGRLGVLDQPEARKVHANPIPRIGGIAMGAGILVSLIAWGSAGELLRAYCAGILILLVFGAADDRFNLNAGWKFLGQIAAALVVMYYGEVSIGVVRHFEAYELPMSVSIPLTLFFIVGATNAINLADGLDGLAGGTTVLCLAGLALLALTGGSPFVATAALICIGSVLGFLRYNTFPARVFMGDAGSQVLGFSAGVLSILLTQDERLPYSATLPLLLLGVPVIDTLSVMTERVLERKSPFHADRRHVHHRLLALGFDHHEAVVVIYGAQAALLVVAWYLRYASDLLVLGVFAVATISVVTILRAAKVRGWHWRRPASGALQVQNSWLGQRIHWLQEDGRLNRWAGYVIAASILAYAMLVILNGVAASADICWLSAAAAVAGLLSMVLRRLRNTAGWLEHAALYVSVLIAVFLDRKGMIEPAIKNYLEWFIFVALALAIFAHLRVTVARRFRITPLDVLVLLAALAIPNLPGSLISGEATGWVVAKALLLIYGIEALSFTMGMQKRMLAGGSLVFLVTVAVRAAI